MATQVLTKPDKIEKVKEALVNSVEYQNNNSLNDAEELKCSVNLDDTSKISQVSYKGPEGKFTVKYDPKTDTATANVNFNTGSFKSTVTKESCEAKGVDPVFHHLWGIFHSAFNQM